LKVTSLRGSKAATGSMLKSDIFAKCVVSASLYYWKLDVNLLWNM